MVYLGIALLASDAPTTEDKLLKVRIPVQKVETVEQIFFTQNLGESHNPISLYVYNSHFSETPALNLGFYFVHALVLANRCKILWGENFQRWTWSSRKNKQIFTSELFAFKSRNIRNYARAHANSI